MDFSVKAFVYLKMCLQNNNNALHVLKISAYSYTYMPNMEVKAYFFKGLMVLCAYFFQTLTFLSKPLLSTNSAYEIPLKPLLA